MSLENRLNRALNQLKILKNSLVSNGKRAIYAGVITSLALTAGTKIANTKAANPDITNPNKDYSWNSSQDNLQNELIASPELGYVIQTENESNMNSLNSMLKSTGATDIKQIGGAGHKNLSIVNNNNAAKNQETIKELKASNQVRYAAPLFSANGETVAVIPEIVARVKPGTDYSQLEELCNSSNLTIKNKMEFTESEYLIEVSGYDANAVFESVNKLNNTKFIEWASPNLAFQPKLCGEAEPGQFIPNDELFPRQWYLDNTRQSGGTPNADINAPEAWAVLGGGGNPNVTIAVLDTGVDYNHPDLFENIWVNKNMLADINLDGKINIWDLDLNQNGSIEDSELNQFGSNKGVIGWDFFDNDISPYPSLDHPSNAHGTAVAGLAAAKGNNRIGVTGVAYDCRIMPIRIIGIDDNGIPNFSTRADVATAFRWAAENGADVINCSWETGFGISIIHSAIKDATVLKGIGRKGKGCIISASSGNDNLLGLG
ncbi:MAG: S8 family serine peptidase, partial [Nanoarchaeota archaeon]|nr:S8 family serine peptidase [Nanoarchaeota archaeon]